MTRRHSFGRALAGAAAAALLTLSLGAQTARAQDEAAFSARAGGGSLVAALLESTPKLHLRLRTEFADQAGFDEAVAYTVRARTGLLTGEYRGFQAFVEYETVEAFGDDRFNGAGVDGDFTKSIVADPDSSRFGEAYLTYTLDDLQLKVGRQRFALGNGIFLGDIDFRQNGQSFDALSVTYRPLPNLELFYSYIYNVNRLLGSQAQRDNSGFDSRTNAFQLAYDAGPLLSVKAYGFLYDLQAGGTDALSNNNYGVLLSGKWDTGSGVEIDYLGEYARQTDAADSPLEYRTDFYNVELGAKAAGVRIAGGRQVYGEDNGVGFANVLDTPFREYFIVTPANGLASNFGKISFDLPWRSFTQLEFRKFRSVADDDDYGNFLEWVAAVPVSPKTLVIGRLTSYRGRDPGPPTNVSPLFPPDTFRYSVQIDYRF